jgi:hypothetical protein
MADKNRAPKLTTSEIALASILLALILAALYATSMIPTLGLTLCSFAGAAVYFAYIEFSRVLAILLYAGSSILGLIIVPNKIELLFYLIFFGVFALVKPVAEEIAAKRVGGTVNDPVIRPFGRKGLRVVRRRSLVIAVAYIIKGVCAALLGGIALAVTNALTGLPLDKMVVLLAVPAFFLYDYLLWLIAEVLGPRLRRIIRR